MSAGVREVDDNQARLLHWGIAVVGSEVRLLRVH
jgi:hypothetical protein